LVADPAARVGGNQSRTSQRGDQQAAGQGMELAGGRTAQTVHRRG